MKAHTQKSDAKVEKQAEEIESLRKMAADTTQSLLRQMIAFWNSFVWVGKLIMAGMYDLLRLECDYNVIWATIVLLVYNKKGYRQICSWVKEKYWANWPNCNCI